MMRLLNHDLRRHLIAVLIGLPLTISTLFLIPLLATVSDDLPQINPMIVVDFREVPEKKTAVVKKPVAPKPKSSDDEPKKAVPQKKYPDILPKKSSNIKKKTAKKAIAKKTIEQPSIKTSSNFKPKKVVKEQNKIEKPTLAESSKDLPVPTPIFKLSSMPRFLHREVPVFPERMKKLGRSATVRLKALIDKDGNVRKVIVEKSAGPEFDQAAVNALKKSSFVPAQQKGRPVAVMLRLPVRFSLL